MSMKLSGAAKNAILAGIGGGRFEFDKMHISKRDCITSIVFSGAMGEMTVALPQGWDNDSSGVDIHVYGGGVNIEISRA